MQCEAESESCCVNSSTY